MCTFKPGLLIVVDLLGLNCDHEGGRPGAARGQAGLEARGRGLVGQEACPSPEGGV